MGAKVNGKIVPLEYKLQNGDIVAVITSKTTAGPSRDWLNIVASSETRSKIRSWFKKEKREENIERGREILMQEAKHLGYNPQGILQDSYLIKVAQKLNILTTDDLLASLGYGGLPFNGILAKLIELYKKDTTPPPTEEASRLLSELRQPQRAAGKKSSHGILVEGETGFAVRLARCCNPIPGDPITGYITRGRGVSVHRSDCPNILNDTEFSRMIDVSWDVAQGDTYTVYLEIICNDRSGLLSEIMAIPAEMKFNISAVTAKPNRLNKTSVIHLGLNVASSTQVTQIITRLRRMKDVFSVSRRMGLED